MIYDCRNLDEARALIGKDVIYSDNLQMIKNHPEYCRKGKLLAVSDSVVSFCFVVKSEAPVVSWKCIREV